MIFPVEEMVSCFSRVMTLCPATSSHRRTANRQHEVGDDAR
jgi:hypothetical protein